MTYQITVSTMSDGPIASARLVAARHLPAEVAASDASRRNIDWTIDRVKP